jgi:hypothetical protein
MDYMNKVQADRVREMAQECGIDCEIFDGWNEDRFFLHPSIDRVSLEDSKHLPHRPDEWVLDLGNKVRPIAAELAKAFRELLDEEDIQYSIEED